MRVPMLMLLVPAMAVGWSALASAALQPTNEYGISLALRGAVAHAESVFTSVLSGAPRDPRALNNLGNTYFLRGDLELALAFYNRAMKGDTADAGIRLNRATVWLMMGDSERATSEAAIGIERAGGEREAAALIGLRAEQGAAPKAAETAWVNKNEIRAMLAKAARKVPSVDTADARKARQAEDSARKPKWRSAGPRGAEGSDAASILYWKH